MSVIDRLEEHALRGELTQAIKTVLDKAVGRGSLPARARPGCGCLYGRRLCSDAAGNR